MNSKSVMMNVYRVVCMAWSVFFGLPVAQAFEVLAPWPNNPVEGIPFPWTAQYHPDIAARTQFKLLKQHGYTVLQLESDMAYGTLVYPFSKPRVLNELAWQWQVLIQPTQANLRTKAGDDAAAKLCVFIQVDQAKLGLGTRAALATARAASGQSLPAATLCYLWATPSARVGDFFDSPFTARVKNKVLQNAANSSQWVFETVDLQADARQIFGKELPEGPVFFTGIALGSDSDNTQSKARALFGLIQVK